MAVSKSWIFPLRALLLAVAAAGAVCFGLLFAATFFNPKLIADSAKSFVIEETKDRYAEYRAQLLQNETADKTLGFLKQRYETKLQDLPQTVTRTEMLIGALIDSFCQTRQCNGIWADPEARRQFSAAHEAGERNKFSQALATIEGFLKNKTQAVLAQLIRDVRIFSGTNLAIYLSLCLLVGLVRAERLRPLMRPAFLLLGSSLLAASLYLFQQNWFFTILYSHYWGYGYLGLVGIIFLSLLDIAFNETRILNGIFGVLGGFVPSL
jgi:hypothetical protein